MVQPSSRLPRCSSGTVCRGLGGRCLWARRWLFLPAGSTTVPLPGVGGATSAPRDARDPPVPSYPYLGWGRRLLARAQTHADAPSAAAAQVSRRAQEHGRTAAGWVQAGMHAAPAAVPAPWPRLTACGGSVGQPPVLLLMSAGSAPRSAPAALGRRRRGHCLPCRVPSVRRLRVRRVPQIPLLAALPQRQLVPCCSPT